MLFNSSITKGVNGVSHHHFHALGTGNLKPAQAVCSCGPNDEALATVKFWLFVFLTKWTQFLALGYIAYLDGTLVMLQKFWERSFASNKTVLTSIFCFKKLFLM